MPTTSSRGGSSRPATVRANTGVRYFSATGFLVGAGALCACMMVAAQSTPDAEPTSSTAQPSRVDRLRSQERASLFQRIQSLIERGAVGLAVRLIDDRQPSPEDDFQSWILWERERLRSYLILGDYDGVVARLSVLPETVDRGERNEFMLLGAEAEIGRGTPAAARKRIRSMVWRSGEESAQTVTAWRRLIIRSYIAERRYQDARTAMLKLDAEATVSDPQWIMLKARVLLLAGDNETVMDLVKGRQRTEAQLFLILARLRSGDVAADVAVEQINAIRAGTEKSDAAVSALAWMIEAEAAFKLNDLVGAVRALENRALVDIQNKDILVPFEMAMVWRGWRQSAENIVDRLGLDSNDVEARMQAAALVGDGDLVSARSLYASIVVDSDDYRNKAKAHTGLVQTLLAQEKTIPLALRIYAERSDTSNKTMTRSRLDELTAQTRMLLADAAINLKDMEAAALLMRGIEQPPTGLTDEQWTLRRARIAVYAGEFEEGASMLQNLVDQSEAIDADLMDRLLQPVFDLQTLGEDQLALPILRRCLSLTKQARFASEIPFWMAQSASALKRHAEATELYLRSADAVDQSSESGNLWRLSALSKAAQEMALSGLPGDARRLYQQVLEGLTDENRRADIERRIQQLFVVEARELRRRRGSTGGI